MANYTVNEVRVKLGKLVEKIFTEDFKIKYESTANQFEDIAHEIMCQEQSNTDIYALLVSKNINSKDFLVNINKIVSPFIVFTFFMRYHFVTCHFIENEQNKMISFPDNDSDFLREIFINYWPSILSK